MKKLGALKNHGGKFFMTKDSDKVEEVWKWKIEEQAEKRAWGKVTKWGHIICINATLGMAWIIQHIGAFLYQNWQSVQNAIDAFIKTPKG